MFCSAGSSEGGQTLMASNDTEREEILRHLAEVEPLLRATCMP